MLNYLFIILYGHSFVFFWYLNISFSLRQITSVAARDMLLCDVFLHTAYFMKYTIDCLAFDALGICLNISL